MATICFSGYKRIYRAKLADVSDIVWLHWEPDEVLQRFTVSHDGTLYFIQHGYISRIIYRTKLNALSGQIEEHYTHTKNVGRIRARTVNGSARIYFSSETESGQDAIYYLSDQNIPVEYYVINPDDLKVYNKCTGEEDWYRYVGDFAFGPDNTLYLSNGNTVPCGVYRVSNAGPDGVNGTVERIYYDFEHSAECLASDGSYVYLRRDVGDWIYRLDCGTHQLELLGDTGEPFSDLCICSESLPGQPVIIRFVAFVLYVYKIAWSWLFSVKPIFRFGRLR